MPQEKEFVQITKERLKELEEAALFLQCLENNGVDNWDGYDQARDMFRELSN